ncbi:MAG TPA: STAS domain-containing protein [Vicinamibacterales bacterium]|nr:STAS domain-containing protein [Vicinamibacterales bacterium]
MQISEEQQEGVVVVAVSGRIDSTTSPTLDDHLVRLAGAGSHRVVMDLSGVDFISSAGLRVMLSLAKRTKAHQGAVVLCGLDASVREVFAMAGFLPLFAVEATRDLAVIRTAGA